MWLDNSVQTITAECVYAVVLALSHCMHVLMITTVYSCVQTDSI